MENRIDSQNAKIWRQLNADRLVTSYNVIFELGVTRLAARIFDLREKYGRDSIKSTRHPEGYAIYSLNKKEQS